MSKDLVEVYVCKSCGREVKNEWGHVPSECPYCGGVVGKKVVVKVKDKVVAYECTWKACKLVLPEGDERIREQLEKHKLPYLRKDSLAVKCPECGSGMRRRVT